MAGVSQRRQQGGMFAGQRAAQGAPAPAPRKPNVPIKGGSSSSTWALLQGLQDEYTFGVGDQLAALAKAAGDRYHGKAFFKSYGNRIKAEHDSDRADTILHPDARKWGKRAGGLLQSATSGPLGAIAKGGARIAEVAPMALRELGTLGAVGAAGGAGSQSVADLATGHRSSVRDYIGAAVGGAVEAAMAKTGHAGNAGAAGAAASSVTQDILNGHVPSYEKAAAAAAQGRFLGAATGAVGRKLSNMLPNTSARWLSKEKLGEAGSIARTWARGDRTATRLKTRFYLRKGGYTYPDQRTVNGQLVESKFGWQADLSKRQKQAHAQPGLDFRVDHFLPEDIGSLVAYPFVQLGYHAADDERRVRALQK